MAHHPCTTFQKWDSELFTPYHLHLHNPSEGSDFSFPWTLQPVSPPTPTITHRYCPLNSWFISESAVIFTTPLFISSLARSMLRLTCKKIRKPSWYDVICKCLTLCYYRICFSFLFLLLVLSPISSLIIRSLPLFLLLYFCLIIALFIQPLHSNLINLE